LASTDSEPQKAILRLAECTGMEITRSLLWSYTASQVSLLIHVINGMWT